jgi:hypothetical protein
MKSLSQSLEELATRVEVLENCATATFAADRVKFDLAAAPASTAGATS